MIDRLEYAAALSYSPYGTSDISKRSQVYRDKLKRADPAFLEQTAVHVSKQIASGHFPGFFGQSATLIPVPGSAPRREAHSLWIAKNLCEALIRAGVAGHLWSPLRRAVAVQKSAFAVRGHRPDVQTHIDSLRMDDRLAPSGIVLLVDDIVTKEPLPMA